MARAEGANGAPRRLRGLAAALALAGCATTIDNRPQNLPITPAFVEQAQRERGIVGSNVVALSLSGGGLRAAAFGFGVIQALARSGPAGDDLFGDLTFISSVSGGSLTAAYVGLHGRAALGRFEREVLVRDYERELRTSLWSPANLLRLVAGGLNDRNHLAATLDADVFRGATFADLYRANKPDVWINATDLFNRTPFPFTPPVFMGLCSDLAQLRVSEAVAASMAVPLVFAPVVLKTWPEHCLSEPPRWVARALEPGDATASVVGATARAVLRYRNPERMRYVKLADGGLTDNQGLASILMARAVSETPHGPFTETDAVRIRRMLFLIVDAGRPPSGDWALRPDGPSGVEVGVAAADAAVDSATRLSAAAFRTMAEDWRRAIVDFRCALPPERARALLPPGSEWRCDDVRFYIGVVGFESLAPARAERLRTMPTRLALSAADIEAAVGAGRDAALDHPVLRRYLSERIGPVGPAVSAASAPAR